MAYVISNGIPIIMSTIFWFVDDIQEGYMDDLHTRFSVRYFSGNTTDTILF